MKQATPPTTIKIFLANGVPDGIRVIQKTGWNGSAVVSSRLQLPEALKREEFQRSGVYLLISQDADEYTLYIGEADVLNTRVRQHTKDSDKDFFTEIVVFTSLDQSLNKAHIRYIESELVRLAKETKQWCVHNKNQPNMTSMSEMDQAEAEQFLQQMLLICPLLGVSAFELPVTQASKRVEEAYPELILNQRNGQGKGYYTNEGFVVLRNSVARADVVASASQWVINDRQQLIDKGILIQDKTGYRFTQDYRFSSPSRAAAVLVGGNANGLDAWKTKKGITLKKLQEQAIDETSP